MNIFLALLQCFLYAHTNAFVRIARIAGILIDFNTCLVIILVLRRFTTFLRKSYYGRIFLAFDEFINLHKFIGSFLLFLGLIHTLFHCINLYYLSSNYLPNKIDLINSTNQTKNSYGELLFGTKTEIGWFFKSTCPTGWALLFILIILQIFSLPCIRSKGAFELFYYIHLLRFVYYFLMIIHSDEFWRWFILPGVLIFSETIYRFYRRKSVKYGDTLIREVNLLPSNVTNLVITRPINFKFKSGDYIFINIPSVASNEWHPFTISSAPEQTKELTLHIRSLGNWTRSLYEHFYVFSRMDPLKQKTHQEFKPVQRKFHHSIVLTEYKNRISKNYINQNKEMAVISNINTINKIENANIKISIDGPYGTASRNIFNSEHAVLIAGGIGVTPFASILQSIWYKYVKIFKKCTHCDHSWYEQIEDKKNNLKKVDFIWVNRDYDSFEWFIELLSQLELQQINAGLVRFLDIHLYMTSAKEAHEIQIDNDKNFKLKIYPGRPNLDILFKNITSQNKGVVDVYFCGNQEFGKKVQEKSIEFKYKFSKEYF